MIDPSFSREPDEENDVIVVCKTEHIVSPQSKRMSEARAVFTVWVGNSQREFASKEKAVDFGQQLALTMTRRLWLDDGGYPPTLLWEPKGGA